jgi:hypothetical protein
LLGACGDTSSSSSSSGSSSTNKNTPCMQQNTASRASQRMPAAPAAASPSRAPAAHMPHAPRHNSSHNLDAMYASAQPGESQQQNAALQPRSPRSINSQQRPNQMQSTGVCTATQTSSVGHKCSRYMESGPRHKCTCASGMSWCGHVKRCSNCTGGGALMPQWQAPCSNTGSSAAHDQWLTARQP